MSLLDEEYDSDQLPEPKDFELVPPDWYDAVISEAEVKKTKDGLGKYIKLRLDITGPSCSGRCVFANINTNNKSADAQEIGRSQLNAIMGAIGVPRLKDTDQLLNQPLQIKVTIKAASGGYDANNEVKAFKAVDGAGSGMPQSQAPVTSGKEPAPWGANK